jgi:L-lactate permease
VAALPVAATLVTLAFLCIQAHLAAISALTGSDTASNVLFGGLKKITAQQVGLSPKLMAAASSSGGVMGKTIDAQGIVVACLVGLPVAPQAHVPLFTALVVGG